MPSEWDNFSVAVVGAAAALSGLLVVAISINIARIVEYPTLPARALQTLMLFVVPLILGLFVLIPGQTRGVLATELIATGLLTGAALLRINRPANRSDVEPREGWFLVRFAPSVLISSMLFIAGVTLAAKAGGGLYWTAPATIVAFVAGLANTWVLLVEILR
jgi:modulator of FtsH protease